MENRVNGFDPIFMLAKVRYQRGTTAFCLWEMPVKEILIIKNCLYLTILSLRCLKDTNASARIVINRNECVK